MHGSRGAGRLLALVSAAAGEGDSEADPGLLALTKASASTVSLASMLTEISRLEAVARSACQPGCSPMSRRGLELLAKSTRGTVNEPGRRVARSLALLYGDDLGGRYYAGNGGRREE